VASDGAPVAIVTGGAGGLGRVIAQRLRADGFRVATADLSGPDGGEGAGELAVRVDVTDPESAEAMCAEVHGRWGRIDVLASWLASQRCSFSTGAAFDLSGGRAVY
jgi:NAD(P)-dependent dehydrogenase (short-subunit alcohol dehydrogenase family)